MTSHHKFGFAALIGPPNAGKSTLLNQIVGQKISIISRRPQTTWHRILGITTTLDYQPGRNKQFIRCRPHYFHD